MKYEEEVVHLEIFLAHYTFFEESVGVLERRGPNFQNMFKGRFFGAITCEEIQTFFYFC